MLILVLDVVSREVCFHVVFVLQGPLLLLHLLTQLVQGHYYSTHHIDWYGYTRTTSQLTGAEHPS